MGSTVNTIHRNEQLWDQLKKLPNAGREMLNGERPQPSAASHNRLKIRAEAARLPIRLKRLQQSSAP